MTQASEAIEAYYKRLKVVGRTRFDPPNTEKQYDPALKGVRFYVFRDGSHVRFHNDEGPNEY